MNLKAKVWYVYIVLCSDNTLYCGISTDVISRINKHNLGKGAKYTKYKCPVNLIYFEKIGSLSQALKRETQIKKMKRSEKLLLCGL